MHDRTKTQSCREDRVLTLHGSKADGEHLLLELAVGEIQSVPHARLVAPSVLLHLDRRHHCKPMKEKKKKPRMSKPIRPVPQIEIAKPKLPPKKSTEVIGADLERLGLPHDEADLGGLLVLEELDGARAPFLPLAPVLVESVELRFPAGTQGTETRGVRRRSKVRAIGSG
jgi:hypothetical protein